jgi:hypothetical protein
MKQRVVLLLFILIYSVEVSSSALAPFAIKAIIDEYLSQFDYKIRVLNFGVRNGQAEKTIVDILGFKDKPMPMAISSIIRNDGFNETIELKSPSILLFDSPEDFNRTQAQIVFRRAYTLVSHPHIVYIHNATIEDIQVAAYKNHTIEKTIFLVNETPHSIDLATAFLFTPEACHTNQFKVINRFIHRQMQWENSKFFVEKYSNFHGCLMEGTNICDVFEDFMKMMNFTCSYETKHLVSYEPISFSFRRLPKSTMESNVVYVIHFEMIKIFVPPGELYGDFEKMLLPFDKFTWIAIGVTIVMAIATIIIIKLKPPVIQNLIFGSNNRSPLMNFVSIVITGGQHTSLNESGPRIFLIIFIFLSLIFR